MFDVSSDIAIISACRCGEPDETSHQLLRKMLEMDGYEILEADGYDGKHFEKVFIVNSTAGSSSRSRNIAYYCHAFSQEYYMHIDKEGVAYKAVPEVCNGSYLAMLEEQGMWRKLFDAPIRYTKFSGLREIPHTSILDKESPDVRCSVFTIK